MADQKVNIKVTAQGAKKTQNELKGVEGAISKMGKAVGIASTAYFGATGLINGFSTAIQLAGRQEQAERALEVALGRTSQSLLNQASALQRVTTFGDEAIISQQAFLASLDFSETQIKDIINASVDLSEATGISLESAVRNTAKTFSGLSGELGELIPQLRDLTTEEMKAGEAVKVMANLFGGTAQAQAETLTGKIEQMKNAVSDAGEAIGGLLSPVVIKVASGIATLADGTGSLINKIKDLADGNSLVGKEFELINMNVQQFKMEIANLSHRELNALRKEFKETGDGIKLMNQETTDQNLKFDALVERMKFLGIIRSEISDDEFSKSLLNDILATDKLAQSTKNRIKFESDLALAKEAQVIADLKNTALSEQSALSAMKTAVRAETMEAIAGYIASVLKNVPFPFNIGLASAGGAIVGGIMDTALGAVKAETGFEGVVTKPTLFLTGENNKPEQVSVTPLGGQAGGSGININIQGNMIGNEEFVRDVLIPEISNARNQNLA